MKPGKEQVPTNSGPNPTEKAVNEAPEKLPARQLPYGSSRLAPAIQLVDLAREIARADEMVAGRTGAQLKIIADQIRFLQQQARSVLEQARADRDLHHAQCRFQRVPGKTYHLYENDDAQPYFSLLGPDEWGSTPPHRYLGSYRLESDMSWTPAEKHGASEEGSAKIIQQLTAMNPDV